MSKPKSEPRLIAEEFCKKHGEHTPSRTIARALIQKHPELFDSLEATRSMIRIIRGNSGDFNREKITNKELFRANRNPETIGKEYSINPVDISIPDFIFPHKHPLVLSDIHFPYHDLKAVCIAIDKGVEKNVDSIYLNGDTLDCYKISRFLQKGGMMSFNEERDMFWQFIDFLKDSIDVPIYFKVGNHEDRWERYIQANASALEDMEEFKLQNVLKLKELGIGFVASRQKCKMGRLDVLHGHEFGESVFSPVNPARGLFLRAKSSVLAGHNHQTSEHHENNLKGDSMACFTTGALCQLRPEYRPFADTKWNHGFCDVEIDADGTFGVNNYRILNGKAR